MSITQFLKLSALVLVLASGPAYAGYKCVDAHGRLSYQDQPCANGEVSSETAQTTENQKNPSRKKPIVVTIPVGKDIAYMVGLPPDWIVEMSDYGDSPTMTARVTGAKPLSLLMTFSPRRMSLGLDESTVVELMKVVEHGHADTNLEKLISTQRVDLIQSKGIGQLNTYLDKNLVNQRNLPDGQFIYTITGVVVIEGRPVTVSIFTNELGTEDYTKALLAVHMLVKAHRK